MSRRCLENEYNERMASTKAETQMFLTMNGQESKMSSNFDPIINQSVRESIYFNQKSTFNHTHNHSISNSNLIKTPDPCLTSIKKFNKKSDSGY